MYGYGLCSKGCMRGVYRQANNVYFRASAQFGGSVHNAERVDAPPELVRAYQDMVTKIPNFRAPTLEFYDDLHGVGGLYMREYDVIAVGMADQQRIADGVVADNALQVITLARQLGRDHGRHLDVRRYAFGSACGRVMAHELGHAMIAQGWRNPFFPDAEAGADYYAGKLDAARRHDWRIGSLIFQHIGCVGRTCAHPTPAARRDAYQRGYGEQQRAA